MGKRNGSVEPHSTGELRGLTERDLNNLLIRNQG